MLLMNTCNICFHGEIRSTSILLVEKIHVYEYVKWLNRAIFEAVDKLDHIRVRM